MSAPQRLQLIGSTASPYTRKMLALLRFRHIPYSISWGDPATKLAALGMEAPKPVFQPTFLFEDERGGIQAVCDSSPIICHLESLYTGRSVLPSDPALAFIDYLLEDFGDEWCTKYMFHYRWYFQEDAEKSGTVLPLGGDVTIPNEQHAQMKSLFTERQVGRLHVVGSNDATAPVIAASYRRFLLAMENHMANQPYMMGQRPGAGDFALYGQLTQLADFDPTPAAIALELSPRTVAWVGQMEDQSGLDPSECDWLKLEDTPDSLRGILEEVGRVYAPAQLANARAVEAGEKTWEAEIDGVLWAQPTFPYQAKCLNWTRERYRALSYTDRLRVDAMLEGTGCELMLHTD